MGVILFMVCSLAVSSRLLVLYARLRQLPELFLGLAYLLAGSVGWGGLLVGALRTPPGQPLAEGYSAWSVIFGDTGTLFFYLFTWYVFRRRSVLAMAIVALAVLAFAASLINDTWLSGLTFGQPPGSITMRAGAIARAAVFPWMAIEAFVSYAAFRRRARLGLGNPLIANRLLLWGVAALSSFTISASAFALFLTAHDGVEATARQNEAGTLYGLCALCAAICNWLAFFPPKAYVRWIESTSTTEVADG